MEVEILYKPGNSAARLKLTPSETIVAEGGAMISMSRDVDIQTSTLSRSGGGILSGLKRLATGESFFLNHFTAKSAEQEVIVATTLAGDMTCLELDGMQILLQSGSFVACENTVDFDLSWQGFKTLFSKEGLFWMKLSGKGKVVINSFGAIYPIEVDGSYIVDTGHIVAFEETLNFKLSKAGKSWISSILGGEGLVCRFEGKGTVWCQSHNASKFGRMIGPKLKPR
jgi:uncharacterized protein (TIGR00266 family)